MGYRYVQDMHSAYLYVFFLKIHTIHTCNLRYVQICTCRTTDAGAARRPHEGREIPSRRAEVMAGGRCGMRGRCGEASEAPMRGPRGMRMRGHCGDAACAGKEAMLQQTCRGFASYGPATHRFSNCFSIGLRRRRRQTYVRT